MTSEDAPMFPPGSIVRLKSGSEDMTVEKIDDDHMVHVVWHSDGWQFLREVFPEAVLVMDMPDDDPTPTIHAQ